MAPPRHNRGGETCCKQPASRQSATSPNLAYLPYYVLPIQFRGLPGFDLLAYSLLSEIYTWKYSSFLMYRMRHKYESMHEPIILYGNSEVINLIMNYMQLLLEYCYL